MKAPKPFYTSKGILFQYTAPLFVNSDLIEYINQGESNWLRYLLPDSFLLDVTEIYIQKKLLEIYDEHTRSAARCILFMQTFIENMLNDLGHKDFIYILMKAEHLNTDKFVLCNYLPSTLKGNAIFASQIAEYIYECVNEREMKEIY